MLKKSFLFFQMNFCIFSAEKKYCMGIFFVMETTLAVLALSGEYRETLAVHLIFVL